jgi:hypothetical protein
MRDRHSFCLLTSTPIRLLEWRASIARTSMAPVTITSGPSGVSVRPGLAALQSPVDQGRRISLASPIVGPTSMTWFAIVCRPWAFPRDRASDCLGPWMVGGPVTFSNQIGLGQNLRRQRCCQSFHHFHQMPLVRTLVMQSGWSCSLPRFLLRSARMAIHEVNDPRMCRGGRRQQFVNG